MKRVILCFTVLALSTAFVLSCKPKKSTPPEPDKEFKSAVYASLANYIVSDIEMMCSFMAENTYNTPNAFFQAYPASGSTVSVTRDTIDNSMNEDQIAMSFNLTRCMDGNVRDGSIRVYVKVDNTNRRYARNPGFQGKVTFDTYRVNEWTISLWDPAAPCYLYNTVPVGSSPLTKNWTWRFAGKLKFTHAKDTSKNMVWEGELLKTLANTSEKGILPVLTGSVLGAINWTAAVVKYHGKYEGYGPQIEDVTETTENVTPKVRYEMAIDEQTPVVRDFLCSPDRISGVALTGTSSVVSRGDEHHPFKQGIASFTVGTNDKFYPRQVYYGNEGEPGLAVQCDNTGEIMIKGIAYRVDFMK